MKKNFYSIFLLLFIASQIFAQCGTRYKDLIFSNVTKTSNVTFSTSNGTTLKLDVYEPTGDTAAMRPLIILAHGGSFYGGDKASDPTVVTLCNNFAKRGYVTASINYRLGDAIQMYLDSSYAVKTVLKALSDGKSAIRFFRKDAATTNTYKVNPGIIFIGGNSAGAVLYMHSIYLDSLGEAPQNMRDTIIAYGGFEGNSGNDGYSSEANALINLAGGVNVPEFVGPNSKPSVNFQGTADNTVPYSCAYPINGAVQVRLCGLGVLEPLYQQFNAHHVSVLFPGDGHCPWDGSAPKLTNVDTTTRNFLYDLMCTGLVGVNEISGDNGISVYPNPVNDQVTVSLKEYARYNSIQLTDITGKVISEKHADASVVTFNRGQLSPGMYLIRILKKDLSSVVRKIIIE